MASGTPAAPVALVTGASQGLGRVVAGYLRELGTALVVTARDPERLDRATAGWGPGVVRVAGPVEAESTQTALAAAVERRGRLDFLINNASELGPSPLRPLTEVSTPTLRHVYEVNVLAPLALVRRLRRPLADAHGLIVNVTSDAAVGGYAGWGAYGASKAALDLVTKTLAQELAPDGVAAVSVDPGDMRTAMHQAAFAGVDISDRPLPEVTVPFWAWLFGQDRTAISGGRFLAQGAHWTVPTP